MSGVAGAGLAGSRLQPALQSSLHTPRPEILIIKFSPDQTDSNSGLASNV